jgi:hypothetical protein
MLDSFANDDGWGAFCSVWSSKAGAKKIGKRPQEP